MGYPFSGQDYIVDKGVYLLLEPLPVGKHVLTFGNASMDITYIVNVVRK